MNGQRFIKLDPDTNKFLGQGVEQVAYFLNDNWTDITVNGTVFLQQPNGFNPTGEPTERKTGITLQNLSFNFLASEDDVAESDKTPRSDCSAIEKAIIRDLGITTEKPKK